MKPPSAVPRMGYTFWGRAEDKQTLGEGWSYVPNICLAKLQNIKMRIRISLGHGKTRFNSVVLGGILLFVKKCYSIITHSMVFCNVGHDVVAVEVVATDLLQQWQQQQLHVMPQKIRSQWILYSIYILAHPRVSLKGVSKYDGRGRLYRCWV